MLRPARLLPPKRLLTPRSARRVSPTSWGLLPGAPVPTRVGLAPTGLVQLSGRTMASECHVAPQELRFKQINVEHHLAHTASPFCQDRVRHPSARNR